MYISNYSSVCFINSLEFLAVRIFTTYISKNWYSFRKTWTIVFTLLYCLGEIVWLSESRQFLSVLWLHFQIARVLGNPLWCWLGNYKLNMESCVALAKTYFGKSLLHYRLISSYFLKILNIFLFISTTNVLEVRCKRWIVWVLNTWQGLMFCTKCRLVISYHS